MSANSDKIAKVREAAAYSLTEAARYLRLPPATLRTWFVGREYSTSDGPKDFLPLIAPASLKPAMLSFTNLIEAHVLWSLRKEHRVPVKALRTALDYAQQKLGIERLLLSPELRTQAGRIFLDQYSELIDLSASGQLAMRMLLEAHLQRVERDESKFPIRLYPVVDRVESGDDRPIAIDPRISFGRPVVLRKGISTATIVGRIDAGETIDDIAADYDLKRSEVEQAALYEHAA
jgi:uncharacterized protein (DUF433 family)